MQVGERERHQQLDNLFRDIITIVADKCVNPDTKRPYPVTMIEKACHDLHLSVHPTKSAKQQALEVIKTLQEANIIPIARAQMRVRITCPGKEAKKLKDKIKSFITTLEEEDWSDDYELVIFMVHWFII